MVGIASFFSRLLELSLWVKKSLMKWAEHKRDFSLGIQSLRRTFFIHSFRLGSSEGNLEMIPMSVSILLDQQ